MSCLLSLFAFQMQHVMALGNKTGGVKPNLFLIVVFSGSSSSVSDSFLARFRVSRIELLALIHCSVCRQAWKGEGGDIFPPGNVHKHTH